MEKKRIWLRTWIAGTPTFPPLPFTAIMAEDSEDAESDRLGNLCVANCSSDREDEAKVYICNNETFSLPQLLSSIWLPEI